jgi:Holliday junction resolvasome RuvABC DNA-binding subunit
MELKDKLGTPDLTAGPVGGGALEARDALVALGWTVIDADRALTDVDESLSTEEQVRQALRRAA